MKACKALPHVSFIFAGKGPLEGGIPELIEDGVTGELFESGNEKQLAKFSSERRK